MNYTIRKGKLEDLDSVMILIQELADYEKEGDQVVVDASILKKEFSKENSPFDFYVAEVNGVIVGTAIYYLKFSTWEGVCVYLEDLIVNLEFRELGIGTALFETLAKYTWKNGYRRMEWQVLDWNEPAIKFYKKLGSSLDGEWINCKLDNITLKKLFDVGV